VNIRTRRLILYSLLVVFLIAGTGLVYYAQGWRLDFKTFTLARVGGIYVRTFPPEANIFLDGKTIKNKSGLIQSGTLISNLFPKNYHLTLTLAGFKSAERNVTVKPSLVTEVDKIVLVPATTTLVAANVKDFWLAGEMVIKNTAGKLSIREREIEIPGDTPAGWTSDFNQALTYNSQNPAYFFYDLTSATSTNLSPILKKLNLNPAPPAKILTDPASNNNLLYHSPLLLSLIDIQRNRSAPLASFTAASGVEISEIAADRFWVVWSEYDKNKKTSGLVAYERSFRTKKILPQTVPGKTLKMEMASGSILGLIQNDGEFYFYRPAENTLTHLASDARDFAFSKNADKVAVLGSKGLEIFSLNGKKYWRFNLADAPQISRLVWYQDGEHLFISYPEKTKFLDLSDAGLEDFIEVAPSGKIQYDSEKNIFYYLKDDKIFAIRFPT
jgi:hypothetical protein